MNHTFEIDPCDVLGVAVTASLQEIHDAYRAKSKKHHPDLGGDPWAFRVVTRSYELLSKARVASRLSEEFQKQPSRPTPEPAPRPRPTAPKPEPGKARRGVRDKVADPARLVAVEMMIIRFEADEPLSFLLERPESRMLSCSLNIAWPSPATDSKQIGPAPTAQALAVLAEAFDSVTTATRVLSARSSVDDGRFSGWLSYTTLERAEEGFVRLRTALAKHGYGVEQWVREMAVPRTDGE